MTDAPERIWANIEDEGDGPFIEMLSDEPWSDETPGVEYVRADLATINKPDEVVISGKTLAEWFEFAQRDDCLDHMVPSDLRQLISAIN